MITQKSLVHSTSSLLTYLKYKKPKIDFMWNYILWPWHQDIIESGRKKIAWIKVPKVHWNELPSINYVWGQNIKNKQNMCKLDSASPQEILNSWCVLGMWNSVGGMQLTKTFPDPKELLEYHRLYLSVISLPFSFPRSLLPFLPSFLPSFSFLPSVFCLPFYLPIIYISVCLPYLSVYLSGLLSISQILPGCWVEGMIAISCQV
jgi:hypothetical protein